MLKEGRVPHKPNIVNLQFKLLSTHIGLGGQDGGQDDVRKPQKEKRKQQLSEELCRVAKETEQEKLK